MTMIRMGRSPRNVAPRSGPGAAGQAGSVGTPAAGEFSVGDGGDEESAETEGSAAGIPPDGLDDGAAATAFPPRILNITAPHVGHLPLTAFRPFFICSSTASPMGRFALHFTQ